MRVAIYSRFSTDSQDAISIIGQVANCEALCEREGLEVVARYSDEGISGNDDHRPQYRKLLDDLECGRIDGVVCDETSRVTRNQAELHRLVAELRFRDQFLLTVDGVDTRSEGSEILLSVKAAMDAMESRKIGTRTYRSLRERHKGGYCAGGRIYGYRIEQDGDYKKRVIDKDQAEVVREIFHRYATGQSAKTIARALNEQGIPSPNGKPCGWPHTTILGSKAKASGILRNTIYIGRPAWGKRVNKRRPGTSSKTQRSRPESEWHVTEDETLRIIDDATWKRVQARLNRAGTGYQKKGRPARYLLTGLLKCGCCGSSYTVRNGRSYACTSQSNGRDSFCTQRGYIYRPMLERELLGGIKNQLLDDYFVKQMAKEIRKQLREGKKPSQASITRKLADLDKRIENVVESLAAVGRSKALTEKLQKLEQQRREVADQAENQSRAPAQFVGADVEKIWRRVVSNLENLKDYAKPDELQTAREALAGIIGEVEIKEEPDGVFAYTKLNTVSGYKAGAQERT